MPCTHSPGLACFVNRTEQNSVDFCSSWEHTPEWQYTSKLLISKHQQVQLLEAASVLE